MGGLTRIVLVGYGVRGEQLARAAARSRAARLVAVVELDAGRARAAPAPAFADLAEALAAVAADGVVIATPPAAHRRDVETAVARGLPVLCEKPLSDDLDEAVAIVRAAGRAEVPLLVGMNFRFQPAMAQVRRLVASGELGAPMFAQLTYCRNRDGRRPDLNDHPLTMPQPMLQEQSIHHLDLLRHAYGREVVEVAADTWNPPTSVYAGDSCVAALLRFEGGLRAQYLGTWTAGTNRFEFRWRTDFEHGVAVQRDQFGPLSTARMAPGGAAGGPRFDTRAEPLRPLPAPPVEPFVTDTAALLTHFAAVAAGTQAPLSDGHDHLRTLALLHACRASAVTGARIDVGSFARQRNVPGGRG